VRKRTRSGRLCRVGWSFCCVVAAVLHRVITVGSAHVVLESGSAFGTSNCRTAAFRRQVGLFELSLSLRIRQRMQSKGKEAFARGSSTHTTRRGTVARAPRGGPRTSQHGPGSNSLGEAASPPRQDGGLVSYAETKRICIGLVHILNQRTQQSGYSGIVGSRQQQQAARFRTWGVPLYSSQGGSMVDGYAQAQQLAEERMLRQLREQASGYFPGVRQRVQSWMQVLWLRQPSRVKGWAPSGRVAGGSSAHTTRWGTVARVPSGGPENSSMWSGQHFSGRSCYPLRGRMGGLVGSSTHSSRCGKGPISIEHTSQVTTALDWDPGWSNSIDADTLRADCTLGNDITRVPLSHRQREHDHQGRQ